MAARSSLERPQKPLPTKAQIEAFIQSAPYRESIQERITNQPTGSLDSDRIVADHFGISPELAANIRLDPSTAIDRRPVPERQHHGKPPFLERLEKNLSLTAADIDYFFQYLATQLSSRQGKKEIELDRQASAIAYTINGDKDTGAFNFSEKAASQTDHNIVTIAERTRPLLLEVIAYLKKEDRI